MAMSALGRGTALHSIGALSRFLAGHSAIGRRDAGYWRRCAGSPYIHEKSFDNRSMIKNVTEGQLFRLKQEYYSCSSIYAVPRIAGTVFHACFRPRCSTFPHYPKVTPSYAAVCRREDVSGSYRAFTPGGDLLDADSMGQARLDRFTASGFSGPACMLALRRTRCA